MYVITSFVICTITSYVISTIIIISLEFDVYELSACSNDVNELNACSKNDDAIGNANIIRKNENGLIIILMQK